MHNLRPQPAARLGIDYQPVSAINPRLVYAATYGYRATGPYRDKPAYDDVIQAGSGLAALLTLLADEPRFMPTFIADKVSSMAVVSVNR